MGARILPTDLGGQLAAAALGGALEIVKTFQTQVQSPNKGPKLDLKSIETTPGLKSKIMIYNNPNLKSRTIHFVYGKESGLLLCNSHSGLPTDSDSLSLKALCNRIYCMGSPNLVFLGHLTFNLGLWT